MGGNFKQTYEYYENLGNHFFTKAQATGIKSLLPVVKACYVEAATNI